MPLRQIQATANSDHKEFGSATIKELSQKEVWFKSLQMLLIFWGIAAFCILLPVVHFVLVPLFFVLGIFLSLRARKFRREIISGEVACPVCKSPLKIEDTPFDEDLREICQICITQIRITPV